MPPKRKRGSKPRASKRSAIRRKLRVVEVGPRGLYWSIKFEGKHLGSVFLKKDAETIGALVRDLASCDGGASLRVKNQWGKHQYETTATRKDDPPSPG